MCSSMQASSLPWMLCTLKRVVGITVKKQNKIQKSLRVEIQHIYFCSGQTMPICCWKFEKHRN